MPDTDDKKNWEKKSERFEVRLPYSKKQAFTEACEEQGDTPSSAVRRFIDAYLRRNDRDNLIMATTALKNMARRKKVPILTGLAATVIGVFGILSLDSTFDRNLAAKAVDVCADTGIHKVDTKGLFKGKIDCNTAIRGATLPDTELFARYDKNANGVLDLGEISANDYHLHKVLDIDGVPGIAAHEFFAEGNMEWAIVKPNSIETGSDGTAPTATIRDATPPTLVTFNLKNPDMPGISSWAQDKGSADVGRTIDRLVRWVDGKSTPDLVFSHHDYGTRTGKPEPTQADDG